MKNYLVVLLFLTLCPVATAELKIVTTTTDYADLARQIGGDKVEVHSVMKGPENVHNVMAKPTEMVFLNKADLFVHSGLDAEPWRDNLLKGARNPQVMPGKPGNVDMSEGDRAARRAAGQCRPLDGRRARLRRPPLHRQPRQRATDDRDAHPRHG